jgi:hypothetical protein
MPLLRLLKVLDFSFFVYIDQGIRLMYLLAVPICLGFESIF